MEGKAPSTDLVENEYPFIDLFWEWWVASTQALADAVGSEGALKALRPYYNNSKAAAAQIIADTFKDMINDPDFYPKVFLFVMEAWVGTRTEIKVENGRWKMKLFGCKTKGECKELCQMTCKLSPENSFKMRNLDMKVVIEKSLFKGDDHCIVLNKITESDLEEDLDNMREIDPWNISKDVLRSFQLQYVSESWVFTTRAFLDCLDPQPTIDKLGMYMRHSGLAYGMNMVKISEEEIRDVLFLGRLIGDINDRHMRKGERKASPDLVEEVVMECPFSQAPPEICLQYEAFFRGICEAVNPEYEFVYDRMMSKGDKTCHWTIKKKGSDVKESPKTDPEVEEMKRTLKWRLTKGEITLEEFHQLRDALMER